MSRLFARLYGAHPLHLLLLLGSFGLIGYTVTLVVDTAMFPQMLLWFAAAVLLHDAVLLPLYAVADRVLTSNGRLRPSVINHVRIPVLASGLLFLLFLPGIIRQGSTTYLAATGQNQGPFLGRWLLLSGLFVLVSLLIYGARTVAARLRRETTRTSDDP